MIGATLNQYQITSSIGAGGMGEVFRARDMRLNRDVAVKVLPKDFASDADRLRRFEQEAKTLAALNHPNILTIHDAGVHEGAPYLVSELLEGRTLREELRSGALPTRKATEYALQIAQGLAAAHDKGVIHRDLKPDNLFVTKDGRVKILDFGLAKLRSADAHIREKESPHGQRADEGIRAPDTEASTAQLAALDTTEPGRVLGTPAYMSPEQVRGETADHRADIFAFGCVLYEMLDGRRPFRRDTTIETMNAILTEEPPELSEAHPNLARALERVVLRCLEKSPERRFQSASDLAFALEGLSGSNAKADTIQANFSMSSARRVAVERSVWIGIVGLLLAGFATQIYKSRRSGSLANPAAAPQGTNVVRFSIRLPTNAPLALGNWTPRIGFESPLMAVAPNGREIAYVAKTTEGTHLFRRALDGWDAQPVPNTGGAIHPFYSPDGHWLGFLTDDKVKKVSLQDGSVQTLCNARTPVRAFWTRDGWIYVAEDEAARLTRVAPQGGSLEMITAIRAGNGYMDQVLPNGKAVLMTRHTNGIRADFADLNVFDFQTKETKLLINRAYDARYVASGHLVFSRNNSIFAVPFDLDRLAIKGEPVTVQSGVNMQSFFAQTQASVSDNGTLIYVPGGDLAAGRIARVDGLGRSEFLENIPEQVYGSFDLAPDDERLAVQIGDVDDYIWVFDFASKQGRRISSVRKGSFPRWRSPGSKEVRYESDVGGRLRFFVQAVDGGSQPTEMFPGASSGSIASLRSTWSPDGDTLIVQMQQADGYKRIGSLGKRPGAEIEWLSPPGHNARQATFSPDSDWIAYASDETGQLEIWILSLEDKKTVRQISTEGGIEPLWFSSGDLFWRRGSKWFVSRVTTKPELRWETPKLAFETDFIDTPGVSYDVSSDGQKLYVVKRTRQPVTDEIRVVQNWFEEFREKK